MRRRTGIAFAIGVLALLVVLPSIGLSIGQSRRSAAYGETPLLGVRYNASESGDCQEVLAIVPKAHYNWLGQVWQDSTLPWEEMRIEFAESENWAEWPHNKAGSILVGEEICGLSKDKRWRWVYIPDEKTLVLDPI